MLANKLFRGELDMAYAGSDCDASVRELRNVRDVRDGFYVESVDATSSGRYMPSGAASHSGFTLLSLSAVTRDLRFMKAIIRAGASVDFGCGVKHEFHGIVKSPTALQRLVDMRALYLGGNSQRWTPEHHSKDLEAIRFLLSVGANPNVAEPQPLAVALQHGDLEVVDLLLLHKAGFPGPGTAVKVHGLQKASQHNGKRGVIKGHDPDAGRYDVLVDTRTLRVKPANLKVDGEDDGADGPQSHTTTLGPARLAGHSKSSKARKEFLKLVKRYQTEVRPPAQCVCGSNRLFSECHGQEMGFPLHPKHPCPCRLYEGGPDAPAGKFKRDKKGRLVTYKSCCLKRGNYLRQNILSLDGTDTVAYEQPPRFVEGKAAQSIAEVMALNDEGFRAQGMTEAEIAQQPMFPGVTPELWKQAQDHMYDSLLPPLVKDGRIDPAYAFATKRSEFMHARPWRLHKGVTLPKAEMKQRQNEWNQSVDEYIADPQQRDSRSALEISKAAKVSWTGGPLYCPCANQACDRVETKPESYSKCSGCMQTKYCGQQCQKQDWKCHKKICGKPEAEPRLPSEVTLTNIMEQMINKDLAAQNIETMTGDFSSYL